jgi:predicted O-methyltransferase YrrM
MTRFPFSREFKEVRGATPDEIGMTLADFATQVPEDQEIVELGVFQGRTALIMAWGAKQGHGAHVTGIDPWDLEGNVYDPPFTEADSRRWAEYRIRELGYSDRVLLIHNFSADVADNWEALNGAQKVGLLYVDGDHTKEGARRDIVSWAPHLVPGAVIAVDDYGHPDWPGVGQAVDELVAEGFLEPIELYHDRLAVTRLAHVVGQPTVKAITSEGVSPSPEDDWMTDPEPDVDPNEHATGDPCSDEWCTDKDRVAEDLTRKSQVSAEEAVNAGINVPVGTPIEDLNTVQLRALAKHRGIALGVRKDKKELILQALRDGA